MHPQKKGMECDLAMGSGKKLEVLWCLPEAYVIFEFCDYFPNVVSHLEARVVCAWMVDVTVGVARDNPDDRQLQLLASCVIFGSSYIVFLCFFFSNIVCKFPKLILSVSAPLSPIPGSTLANGTGWRKSSAGTSRQRKPESSRAWWIGACWPTVSYPKWLSMLERSCSHLGRSSMLLDQIH